MPYPESRKQMDEVMQLAHKFHGLKKENTPAQSVAVTQSLIRIDRITALRELLAVFDHPFTYDRERIIILREIETEEKAIRDLLKNV